MGIPAFAAKLAILCLTYETNQLFYLGITAVLAHIQTEKEKLAGNFLAGFSK